MEQKVVLLMFVYIWGVSGKVDHAELRGEHPKPEHIDEGQCRPVPCDLGIPPKECKVLCSSRHYEAICQPPADFCLCRHIVNGEWILVSPDEIDEEPPESPLAVDQPSEEVKVAAQPLEPSKVADQTPEQPEEEVVSYQIFAVFLPIKRFYESFQDGDSTPQPVGDLHSLGYEPVNVHEGRLFWDFRYILTGLLLLMIGLVVYELMMCAKQANGAKEEYERSEVTIKLPITEKEKILNV